MVAVVMEIGMLSFLVTKGKKKKQVVHLYIFAYYLQDTTLCTCVDLNHFLL